MKANCEPPVNITRLSTLACATVRPAATASAPNETPYAPVATPMDRAWRRTAARAGSDVTSGERGRQPELGDLGAVRRGEGPAGSVRDHPRRGEEVPQNGVRQ